MIKSFKIMLIPNNLQRTRLFQFAGTARFTYNWALRKEIDAYETGEKFISNFDLRKEFTVLRNSAEYAWLRTISNRFNTKYGNLIQSESPTGRKNLFVGLILLFSFVNRNF